MLCYRERCQEQRSNQDYLPRRGGVISSERRCREVGSAGRAGVKVDNANRIAVLDEQGIVLPGAAEALGAEDNINIAKISWLSNRESGKAYGSMVVYVTKGSDAKRLLEGRYFDLAGIGLHKRL